MVRARCGPASDQEIQTGQFRIQAISGNMLLIIAAVSEALRREHMKDM